MSRGTKTDARSSRQALRGSDLRVTMIRCSTVLLEQGDLRVLTDPWFGMRMLGMRCLRAPGVTVEALPPLDALLVSHLHPDHYDERAVAEMRPAPKLTILPPRGLAHLRAVPGAHEELAPWAATMVGKVKITAVPASHTFPPPAEVNFVLDYPGFGRVFFGGDTRFDRGQLDQISRRFAPVRLALLPVGGTRVFGRRTSMAPRDAERAADILGAQTIVPIHEGGVWPSVPPLSLHPGRAAHLVERFERRGEPGRVVALREGESAWLQGAGEGVPEGPA